VIIACFYYLSFVSPNIPGYRSRLILRLKRGGAIAWAVVIFVRGAASIISSFPLTRSGSQLYSLAGSIFLLIRGQYFFFVFPEWYIYGGIGMAVAVLAAVNILALSNVSVHSICPTAGIMESAHRWYEC
jgi:hypothetical protein